MTVEVVLITTIVTRSSIRAHLCFPLLPPGQAKRNEDAVFERNNLQCQLRDLQHILDQKQALVLQLQRRQGAAVTEAAQLQVHAASLQDKLDRVRTFDTRWCKMDCAQQQCDFALSRGGS